MDALTEYERTALLEIDAAERPVSPARLAERMVMLHGVDASDALVHVIQNLIRKELARQQRQAGSGGGGMLSPTPEPTWRSGSGRWPTLRR